MKIYIYQTLLINYSEYTYVELIYTLNLCFDGVPVPKIINILFSYFESVYIFITVLYSCTLIKEYYKNI